jgi:hypothetical protein
MRVSPVLVVLGVGVSLAVVLALAGRFTLRRLGVASLDDRRFATTAGFLVGEALLLVGLLPATFGHARSLTRLVIAALAGAAVAETRQLRRAGSLGRVMITIGAATGLGIVLSCSTLALMLWPLAPRWLIPLSLNHLGSFHSGRYANLALLIVEQDRLPHVQQNVGQALLVAVHLFLGAWAPLVSLTLWIGVNAAWVTLLVSALLGRLLRSRRWILPGTLIVVAGNTGLSLRNMMVVDNGNPIVFMGYADVVASAGTFLLFLWYLVERPRRRMPAPPRSLALIALLGAAWAVSAPLIVVAGLAATGTVAALEAVARRWRETLRGLAVGLALLAGVAAAAPCAGMFMPVRLVEDTGIPGMLSAEGNGKGLEWNVYMPGFRGIPWPQYPWTVRYDEPLPPPHDARWLAGRLRAAVQMFALPLLGTFAMLLLRRRWGMVSAACILPAFAIALACTWSGYKWELTRFLIPGIVLGMMGLVVAADELTHRLRPGPARAAILLVLAATLAGPICDAFIVVGGNLFGTWESSLQERLSLWAETQAPL